jgi:hypothetical protein
MATAKTNHRPALEIRAIRPALVEARLMTAKRASDAVYVATLAEELRTIEGKISAMEDVLSFNSEGASELPSQKPPRPEEGDWNAEWIRKKSGELNLRLRRLERPNNKL